MTMPESSGDMLIIGGRSVLGIWVADLVGGICIRMEPPIENHVVDFGAEVADIGGTGEGRRLVVVRRPTLAALEAIADGRVPVIAVIDDPVDSVRFIQLLSHLDLFTALREQTAAAAGLYLSLGNDRVLMVRRGMRSSARAVADAMLAHFNLDLPADVGEFVIAAFCGPAEVGLSLEAALGRRAGHLPLDQVPGAVTAGDATVIRQVLSPLLLGAIDKDIGPIVWPARAFFYGDQPNEPPPPVVDLTGSARLIYYGPYFHLPPGLWSAKIIVAFTHGANGLLFNLDVLCNLQTMARFEIKPIGAGAFEGSFTLRHTQPHHSIEINLVSREASIEGHIALGQMVFTRIGD